MAQSSAEGAFCPVLLEGLFLPPCRSRGVKVWALWGRMEKQRAKKEKVRLQRDTTAETGAPLSAESARRATEESEPGPVLQEQRKTERHKFPRLRLSLKRGQLQRGKPELPVYLK